ncbi:hypothetical protein COA01_23195 [Bacillus cereus]|uniref:hypothetical protein n=1 Tax=Bacillus cereus TaxID=1396 RepID=UPI000BFEA8FA|nr:hypothetical protein [Bacillus cereus]PGP18651.1 hypothetical protein COA01_23195 [Bacillus cereus]
MARRKNKPEIINVDVFQTNEYTLYYKFDYRFTKNGVQSHELKINTMEKSFLIASRTGITIMDDEFFHDVLQQLQLKILMDTNLDAIEDLYLSPDHIGLDTDYVLTGYYQRNIQSERASVFLEQFENKYFKPGFLRYLKQ